MGELKEWRCMECGQVVFSSDHPNSIRWSDGHVCYFSEYEEPDHEVLNFAKRRKELGEAIKNWPDV